MREFLLTPKYEQNVSERTTYSNHGLSCMAERYYKRVEIRMRSDQEPTIDIDYVFGENMIEYLSNKYPGCKLEYQMFDQSGVDYTPRGLICEDDDGSEWKVERKELWVYTELLVVEKQKID